MPEHVIPPEQKRSAPGYVARILQHDAEDAAARAAARKRRPRRRWGASGLVGLVPVLVLLTAWNVYRGIREPAVATPAEELATARFTLYLVAQELEAHRREHGALPATLDAINADEERITYARRGPEYTLTAQVAGQTLTYRSGADPLPFWSAAEELPQGGGR
jgi:hypothetical protein